MLQLKKVILHQRSENVCFFKDHFLLSLYCVFWSCNICTNLAYFSFVVVDILFYVVFLLHIVLILMVLFASCCSAKWDFNFVCFIHMLLTFVLEDYFLLCFLTHLCFDDVYSMITHCRVVIQRAVNTFPTFLCSVFCFVCLFLLLCHSQCNSVCSGGREGGARGKEI